MKLKLALAVSVFLFPVTALAASHTYSCSELTLGSGVSCSSGTITFSATGGDAYDTIPTYNLNGTATWYLHISVSGTGTGKVRIAGNNFDPSNTDFTTTGTYTLSPAAGNTTGSLLFRDNNSFAGTVGNICIDDDNASCAPPPPPPNPTPWVVLGSLPNRFASSTCSETQPTSSNPIFSCFSTTTPEVIDLTQVDVLGGIALAFAVMWFIVWIILRL